MQINRLFILALCLVSIIPQVHGQDEIILTQIASGFNTPVDITNVGDERLFIVEKQGIIRIMDTIGQVMPVPFLDIEVRVNSGSNERGLLGMAFHPEYATNGFFFVNYSGLDGNTVIARYQRDSVNPNIADPNSARVFLGIGQPFSNHNAGDLAFGPDGYLYIGTGDGGSGGDPGNRAQNPFEYLGKMLRIDVDSGDPYSIPPDNPFADDASALDEIWSIGLRNPWRFCFDRLTGDFYIADVGQNEWEEINFQPAGASGGRNYGWRCYEANAAFNNNGCPPVDSFTAPVFSYPHQGFNCGGSVTGGFVYRGARFPALYGTYIFTDYCNGIFRGFRVDSNGVAVDGRVLAELNSFEYTSFGEDASGELYVAGGSGRIYKLEQTPLSSTSKIIKGEWAVYPIPTNDKIRFVKKGSLSQEIEVVLYNALGNIVLSAEMNPLDQLSISHLSAGMYYAHLLDDSQTHLVKLVKH